MTAYTGPRVGAVGEHNESRTFKLFGLLALALLALAIGAIGGFAIGYLWSYSLVEMPRMGHLLHGGYGALVGGIALVVAAFVGRYFFRRRKTSGNKP